jgi:hypothetical protein
VPIAPPVNDFTLELAHPFWGVQPLDARLRVRPLVWSAKAMGGPHKAEVEVYGPPDALWPALRWLGLRANIRSADGALVWWGMLAEVEVVADGIGVGLSLSEMSNRVRVIYAWDDLNGEAVDGTTAAADDTASQAEYGVKELLHSAGEASPDAALALRDRILASAGQPVATARAYGNREPVAILHLQGHWQQTGWRYYENTGGKQVYDESGDAEQRVGWAVTGTDIAFAVSSSKIAKRGAALAGLRKGDRFTVSGSSVANNVRWEVASEPEPDEPYSYTATTIAFDLNDDINDSAKGLGEFGSDDIIYVTGSSGNNGYHKLDSAGPPSLTTDTGFGGIIGTEAAGPSITIEQLVGVKLTSRPYLEYPGASVTLTLDGQAIAQKVYIATAMTLDEALFLVRKEGGPADGLQCKLYSDNPATGPNTVLATSATRAASTLATKQRWETFTFASPPTLSAGTWYWVGLQRTGAASATAHYLVGVNEDMTDTTGVLKVKDGGSLWTEREPNADMPYQLWSKAETTAQAASMLAMLDWVEQVSILQASGLMTRYWRDGSQTVQDELEKLLEQGTSWGAPLWARVDASRNVSIVTDTVPDRTADWLLSGDLLYRPDGSLAPRGLVPAGAWATLSALPAGTLAASLSPVFLEEIEYDARRGVWAWTPRGRFDPIADWKIRQG